MADASHDAFLLCSPRLYRVTLPFTPQIDDHFAVQCMQQSRTFFRRHPSGHDKHSCVRFYSYLLGLKPPSPTTEQDSEETDEPMDDADMFRMDQKIAAYLRAVVGGGAPLMIM